MKRCVIKGVLFACAMAIMIPFISCNDKEDVAVAEPAFKYAVDGASPATLTAAAEGVVKTVTVEATGAWRIAVSAGAEQWLHIWPASGEKNGSFVFTVNANAATVTRTGTLTFSVDNNVMGSLSVTQDAFVSPINMEKAVEWFYDRMDRGVCYNMNARYEVGDYVDLNSNGCVEGDCSSAVTYAVLQAGASDWGPLNTDSMHAWLTAHGFQVISQGAGKIFNAQRGDIFIWGQKGYSGGAAGHTGIFINDNDVIHLSYGCNGICVNDYNQLLAWNDGSNTYEYLYRFL